MDKFCTILEQEFENLSHKAKQSSTALECNKETFEQVF